MANIVQHTHNIRIGTICQMNWTLLESSLIICNVCGSWLVVVFVCTRPATAIVVLFSSSFFCVCACNLRDIVQCCLIWSRHSNAFEYFALLLCDAVCNFRLEAHNRILRVFHSLSSCIQTLLTVVGQHSRTHTQNPHQMEDTRSQQQRKQYHEYVGTNIM